jgi:hypothetical protein
MSNEIGTTMAYEQCLKYLKCSESEKKKLMEKDDSHIDAAPKALGLNINF